MSILMDLEAAIKRYPRGKGLALIVGCEKGPPGEKFEMLHGVKKDVEMMTATFCDTLKYCVLTVPNPTVDQLQKVLRDVARREDYPRSFRRFVFIFAGHGCRDLRGEDALIVTDGRVRITTDIISPLENKHAPALATLPKLFFIDACRGTQKDVGTDVLVPRGANVPECIKVPEGGNMLTAYSTLPHYEALEGIKGGLWLQTLSKELKTSSDSITEVLRSVRINVLKECKGVQMQVAETSESLLERVCFLTEAEGDEEEAMDTGNGSGPLADPPHQSHNPNFPAASIQRHEAQARGPTTTELFRFLTDIGQKCDEKYVEDAATGMTRYKCTLECLCGGQRQRAESGYSSTREASTEEAAKKLLPIVKSLTPRSGGGKERPPPATKQLEDHFKRVGKSVKYDTKRTPSKRYLSYVFVPELGRVEGKEERSEEKAKDSAASEALKKLNLL